MGCKCMEQMDWFRRILVVSFIAFCIAMLFFYGNVTLAHAEESEMMWPANGVLTDTFGTRSGTHHGIDIAAEPGETVRASLAGTVYKSYYSSSYGNVIFIRHANGYETVYAHLLERYRYEGDFVERGEAIGTVGNTGRSSGSHLHFEVHKGPWNLEKSHAINPMRLLAHESKRVASEEETVQTMIRKRAMRQSKGEMIVKIQAGDTLSELSKQYDVTVPRLQKWNDLHSDLIIAGEYLVIYPE